MAQKLYIKNMVCGRCIEAVEQELAKVGMSVASINLGEVELKDAPSKEDLALLGTALQQRGFELLQDKNSRLIEQIKTLVIDSIHHQQTPIGSNYSDFLAKNIGKDYSALSSLFSSVEGMTIERFIILQKLEKVKEFLIYDELSLSQIASQLGYNSVQHLSNQFKKNTGMSPSEFKKLQFPMRNTIDNIDA